MLRSAPGAAAEVEACGDTEAVCAQGWSDTTKPEDIAGKVAGAAELLIPCLGEFLVK